MSYNEVILLLGTNLGDKKLNLDKAKINISHNIGEIVSKSKIIETVAEGYVSENLFLNQTVKIKTNKSPMKILERIKYIEKAMGRTYIESEQKYQDRVIDIDILLFNKIRFESQILTIPHHQINTRNFIKIIIDCY